VSLALVPSSFILSHGSYKGRKAPQATEEKEPQKQEAVKGMPCESSYMNLVFEK